MLFWLFINSMATICYAWNDTPFAWIDTPFTWAEGCVIEKIVGGGGSIPSYKIRERLNALPEEEKEVLINLFIRLDVDEIEFERQINKNKNTKVKIKLSDVEMSLKEQRFIKVNVKINEQ
jgi:hypothetical protein